MAETKTLTDHEEIREWAGARSGKAAMQRPRESLGQTEPVLRLVFGQDPIEDYDRPDRPDSMTTIELVEWGEWFQIFEDKQLALVVSILDHQAQDHFHEFIVRD